MQQKILLINSMQKLINHIMVSKKNQEEIFASLSKNDFKKIISNLDDQNLRLRKISLALISQLLYNNNALKEKFCHIMSIPLCPGRVALSTKLCALSNRSKEDIAINTSKNVKQVFTLLKQTISEHEKQCFFWFINFENSNQSSLKLQYLTINQSQTINVNQLLDPIDCMIGFIMPDRVPIRKTQNFITTNNTEQRKRSQYELTNSTKLVNNYFKPNVSRPQQQTKNYPSNNLNQSLNLTPGYSTDRQMNYGPKQATIIRGANSSMHQQTPHIHDSKQAEFTPPASYIKPNAYDIQNYNRSKYAGIKLTNNSITTTKNRQQGRYIEEHPVFAGSITTQGGKSISYYNPSNGMVTNNNNSAAKNMNASMRERGYQTLREKKVVEKYP